MQNRIGHRFQRRLDVPVWIERGPQGQSYADKVLGVAPAYLLAGWPLWEDAGLNAENIEGTVARDGTYTGVTLGQPGIGDGRTVALFDGVTSFVNVYSASLAGVFDPNEGALLAWAEVSGAGVWADGAIRTVVNLQADAGNRIISRKEAAANTFNVLWGGGFVFSSATIVSAANTNFMALLMTWSKADNELRGYLDGTQVGGTQAMGGVWAGPLGVGGAIIGSRTLGPAEAWSGVAGHVYLWGGLGSPAAIQAAAVELATV